MAYRIIIFLVLNFAALGIGGLFTGEGVPSAWYNELNKAPWSPPGWVFGFAWTTIMICFAIYMSYAWVKVSDLKLLGILFAVQWVLNIAWNPAFFYFHQVAIALVIISLLLVLVGYFLVSYRTDLKAYSLLIMPYFIWLIIATSLHAYTLIKN